MDTGTRGDRAERLVTLRESEDRFRLLVESVVDYGIFILDVDGHVTSWNAGAERMKGYGTDEIVGSHFSIFYPSEERTAARCERELAIAASVGRFEEEGVRVRKDGSTFWANVVITAIRASDGSLLGFGQVTRDLSERRRAEEQLRQSEERLRLLIASVKDYAIFVLDPTGHVTTWNPGAERLKGYRAEEIIGQHFSRFYPDGPGRLAKCEDELVVAIQAGRFEEEGWRIRKDGSRFWANVVITPIRHADGQILGFAKVTRDLTDRKRHEEERLALARTEEARAAAAANEGRLLALASELARARDRAEEATKVKDDFLATVSHELRTPLNAMLGWARLLHAGSLSAEKQPHAIETIVRNAIAQKQIIDDLLDVARIISGQLRLEVELVDINQVVTSSIDVVRPAADAKGVSLEWDICPAAGGIQGDGGRIQQILWNLLSNAVKFTPRGGNVHVTLRRVGSELGGGASSWVEVEIADTGRGIASEFLPHVFERFTQEDASRARQSGGLGLGLAIVKHLIELHGGTIEARSGGVGAGSSFIVRLPVAPLRTTPTQSWMATPPSGDELHYPPELSGLKVLVVDDDVDARELAQSVLERGGAKVMLASSAKEAREVLRAHRPDVIVSDVGMPEEDGYAFLRALRATSRDDGGRIPAVALTAYARMEDRRMALVAGFQNHATKPIEPQELLMVVANLAGRYA